MKLIIAFCTAILLSLSAVASADPIIIKYATLLL